MTAAARPNTPNRADWAWHMKPPSPPLELQFLPPSDAASAAGATSSDRRTPPVTPWTVDPSRLQKLMMGSVAAPASALSTGSRSSSHVPDFGSFFDPAINQTLPSGWERCLDLKSGEVFIKKCETNTNGAGVLPAQFSHDFVQCTRPSRVTESIGQVDEQQLDWSLRWMHGKPTMRTQNLMSNDRSFIKRDVRLYCGEERQSSPDEQPLCLDLDLRLTSDSRSRLASEASDIACSQSLKPILSTRISRDASSQSNVQPWKWPQVAQSSERPASIQEMVSESTMATAVCSKCVMYVLLKKSNPTCPRCFNPIILDCGTQLPPVQKRPRLELSPDDLSLSTDSSR